MAISPLPDPNKPAVYDAEFMWQRTVPEAGQQISSHQARRLSRQILMHPSLDNEPGIDKARKSVLTRVTVRSRLLPKIAPGTQAATNGLGMTFLSKDRPITAGVITHEVTHKILAHTDDNPGHGAGFPELHQRVARAALGPVAATRLSAVHKQHGAV